MPITNGLLCDVYLNLHKAGFLSVRAAEGPDKGRVVGHVSAIELEGCTFRVSEAGRQRVIRERAKNVHATVRGRVVDMCLEPSPSACLTEKHSAILTAGGNDTTYQPYYTPTFINRETKQPVHTAQTVVIVGKFVAAAGA
ncbi:MAG: hypothetical protein FD131_4605 [Rhodocyclaceae bacterium]|nr:MAG: hypothetical protein FD131_4605 [Rhodocyclaceae bacterium]